MALPFCLDSPIVDRRLSPRSETSGFDILTGIPVVDREHAKLVEHLDRLQADQEAHPTSDAFTDLLSRLGRQINAHFDSEEAILRACGMPSDMVLEHIRAHSAILEQYARLNLELMAGNPVTRDEALEIVRDWIIGHVLQHDMKLVDYASADT